MTRLLLSALTYLSDRVLAESIVGDLEEERGRRAAQSRWRAAAWFARESAALLIYAAATSLVRVPIALASLCNGLRPSRREGRQTIRSLRQTPWYSITVIGVVALSMALATTVFAVVDGVLFKSLPYRDSRELYLVSGGYLTGQYSGISVSARDVHDWAAAVPTASFSLFQVRSGRGTLLAWDPSAAAVDERFLDVLGVRPIIGGFERRDFEARGGSIPALVSYGAWQTVLGGRFDVVGETLPGTVGAQHYRVAGVLPSDFLFPARGARRLDILTPLVLSRRETEDRHMRAFQAIARLPDDEPFSSYQARLDASAQRSVSDWIHRIGEANGAYDHVGLDRLDSYLTDRQRPLFVTIFATAAALILLGAVNVSGLMASRTEDRSRELAVRRALGADGLRVAKLIVLEGAILVAAGSALGVLVARPLLALTVRLLPENLGLLKVPSIDFRVGSFAGLVGMVVVALVSAWSIRRSQRPGLLCGLVDGMPSTCRARSFARFMLVAAQVSGGLILTIGGALLVGSLIRVTIEDPGYKSQRILLIEASLGRETFRSKLLTLAEIVDRVPGVERVVSFDGPFLERSFRADVSWRVPAGATRHCLWGPKTGVSAGFFQLMGIRRVSGRLPTDNEVETAQPWVVASEKTARACFPGRDPIGQHLEFAEREFTVIGVVADARFGALDTEDQGGVYVSNVLLPPFGRVVLAAELGTGSGQVLPVLTENLRAAGFIGDVTNIRMLDDSLAETIRLRRAQAWVFGAFSLAALAIVGVGILGLMAMTTARRTREIGVRIALGATRESMMRLLLREQFVAVAAGLGAGAMLSVWLAGFVRAYVYKLTVYDPRVWSAALATVLLTAAIGAFIPAWRASRVNPVRALRVE